MVYLKEVLISAKDIEKQCQTIAKLIDQKYGQEPLVFVCLLKGAYIFTTDLIKQVKNPNTEVEFIVVSSCHNGKSLGEIDVILDLKKSIKDKNVIIVEDILDTGRTLSKISEIFKTRGAKNIEIAVCA